MSTSNLPVLRCIAVDDEPLALSVLCTHAVKIPFLGSFNTFVSANEALTHLQATPVDVLFLDVEMPDMSGLEVAELLRNRATIIFTTAYPEFAVKGFDLAAADYLLKPIGFSRFLQACIRAQQHTNLGVTPDLPIGPTNLFLKDGTAWVRIDLLHLLYIEAAGNYLSFHQPEHRTVVRLTLKEAMSRVPAGQFLRVHKSYAIALAHVEKIERHQVVVGGTTIPLSAKGHEELLRILG